MMAEALSHQNHRSQVKNKAKELVKDIPFFILLLNGISALILSFAPKIDYNSPDADKQYIQHMNDYDFIYSFLSEFTDFSIPLVLFMAFYAYTHRFCIYSWICIGTLGLLNVTNILHYFLNFGYISLYAGLIILTGLTFAIIKWKTLYYKNF